MSPNVLAQLTASDRRLLRELALKLACRSGGAAADEPPPAPPDLHPYIPAWASALLREGKSGETVRTYAYHINGMLRVHPSPTAEELAAYTSRATGRPRSSDTVHVETCALKSFFGYLAKTGVLAEDIGASLKSPRRAYHRREPAEPLAIARLLADPGVPHHTRTLILLLADTGLRIQEAVTIQLADVNLDNMTVTVVGKGSKPRTVPFSATTLAALRQHIGSLPPASPWLFPGLKPHRHLTQDGVQRRLRRDCDRLGLKRFSPHQLRHYFATAMLNDGANLRVVSELLGHATPSVTANVYWHSAGAEHRRREHEQHSPLRAILNQQVSREEKDVDTP